MVFKTAWKNVWRNKIRSLVVIMSIVIGIFAGVFIIAMMNGMMLHRIDSVKNNEVSDIQITQKKFRDYKELQFTITNCNEIGNKLISNAKVEAISKRTIITGMANSANKNSGVQIIGVNPEDEIKVFELYNKIIPETGSYFPINSKKKNLAIIGEALAKELNIIRYRINNKVIDSLSRQKLPHDVITLLIPFKDKRFKNEKLFLSALKSVLSEEQINKYGKDIALSSKTFRERSKLILTFLDKDNNQTGARFKVAGIYNTSNNMFEKTDVFVLNSDIKPLVGLENNEYHKIIIKLKKEVDADSFFENIKLLFPDLDIVNWRVLQPELAMSVDMVTQFYIVFLLIILVALSFGIVNTMLMVVLERTKELGMLTAIGMNKKKVFSMIILESIFLSLIGGFVGMIFSELIISLTAKTGINFSMYAEGFEAMGYPSIVYPEISYDFFIIVTIMIIITGVLSAIYPAYKALKLNPVEAIRSE